MICDKVCSYMGLTIWLRSRGLLNLDLNQLAIISWISRAPLPVYTLLRVCKDRESNSGDLNIIQVQKLDKSVCFSNGHCCIFWSEIGCSFVQKNVWYQEAKRFLSPIFFIIWTKLFMVEFCWGFIFNLIFILYIKNKVHVYSVSKMLHYM